jgi:hypothetical protein
VSIYGPSITIGELALTIAMGEVGAQEDPGRPNRGPRVDQYLRATGLDPNRGSFPWCAAGVSWVMRETCMRWGPLRFRGSASVSTLYARNRQLEVAVREGQPGDVFIHLGAKGNHCGFVSLVRGDGFSTVEFNSNRKGSRTGGMVLHHNRPRSYVTHLIRPA